MSFSIVDDGEGEAAAGVVSEGLAEGFGTGLVTTPLSQINFFPLLIQVYFLPPEIEILPALLHEAPALVAAVE